MNNSKPSLYAWFVVMSLAIVGCINYLDRTIITTMRVSIEDAIPMTEAQFGLLTSVFLWVYGILSPFAGFLADRFNRSRVIIISLFLWSVVTWITAFSTSFTELLITRILMGVSEACYMPAALALIVDYHRGSTRSLATGINLAGVMIGSSLGFLGGMVAEAHNWNTIFIYLGIFGVIFSAILMFTLRDPHSKKDNKVSKESSLPKVKFFMTIKKLFKMRSYIQLLIAWGLCGAVTWLVVGWLPTYFQVNFNLSQGIAGFYATSYLYPSALVGLLFGGYLADQWSKRNRNARILVPIIGLCIGVPCIFIASETIILPLAIILFSVYSFSRVFFDTNMMPILSLFINPRSRATGYGILNLIACVIGGVGIYAGGALRDSNISLSRVFQLAALIMGISVVLLFMVKRRSIGAGD